MFTLVVIAVAIGVFTMYFRHEAQMRRKRREQLDRGDDPAAPPEDRDPR